MTAPFVYVRWMDAEHPTTGEWLHAGDVNRKSNLLVETGGFLVNRDKSRVQVAVSVASRNTPDEQYTGIMTIPMGCVETIQELPFGGPPKTLYRKRGTK